MASQIKITQHVTDNTTSHNVVTATNNNQRQEQNASNTRPFMTY